MNKGGRASWRNSMETKKLYQLTVDSFTTERVCVLDEDGALGREFDHIAGDRVGNDWAAGRLKIGDIILCDEVSSDHFYDFYLVDFTDYSNRDGVRMTLIPYKFGAYDMSAKKIDGLTKKEYHLLMAGEQVEVKVTL